MERIPFLMKTGPVSVSADAWLVTAQQLRALGAENLSIWTVEDFIFGYCEAETDNIRAIGDALRGFAAQRQLLLLASPGNMRLMYSALGNPRAEKDSLGHRVFLTRLKPGCAAEYKARHDRLAEMQSKMPPREQPTNNFTVWNAGDMICGYSELDPGYEIDRSEKAMQASAPWETRMLEIMDWLTDDVDPISGETHDPIRRLA